MERQKDKKTKISKKWRLCLQQGVVVFAVCRDDDKLQAIQTQNPAACIQGHTKDIQDQVCGDVIETVSAWEKNGEG